MKWNYQNLDIFPFQKKIINSISLRVKELFRLSILWWDLAVCCQICVYKIISTIFFFSGWYLRTWWYPCFSLDITNLYILSFFLHPSCWNFVDFIDFSQWSSFLLYWFSLLYCFLLHWFFFFLLKSLLLPFCFGFLLGFFFPVHWCGSSSLETPSFYNDMNI